MNYDDSSWNSIPQSLCSDISHAMKKKDTTLRRRGECNNWGAGGGPESTTVSTLGTHFLSLPLLEL